MHLYIYIIPDDNGQLDAGESRIRVRNWLMLADQSIIGKSSDESTGIYNSLPVFFTIFYLLLYNLYNFCNYYKPEQIDSQSVHDLRLFIEPVLITITSYFMIPSQISLLGHILLGLPRQYFFLSSLIAISQYNFFLFQ